MVVEIEVDGVYLQYAVDTTDIQIGNRVEVTFDGELEDKKIKNISIDRKAVTELGNEGSVEAENKKNVIYLDKNGNVIQDLEEFKENIKKKKEEEEAAKLAEIEALNKQNQELVNGEQENVTPAEETPIPSEEPKNITTIQIMYYGKADARTIEVMHDGAMKAMYLNSDAVAKQFDSIDLEKQLNVEVFVDASGNYVINSIK